MQGNDEPLTAIGEWATTFSDHEGAKALTVESIVLNCDPLPLQKRHRACDEVGLSTAAITTSALVKDLWCHIVASNVNKVAPHSNVVDHRM